jgi:hypothetical protein
LHWACVVFLVFIVFPPVNAIFVHHVQRSAGDRPNPEAIEKSDEGEAEAGAKRGVRGSLTTVTGLHTTAAVAGSHVAVAVAFIGSQCRRDDDHAYETVRRELLLVAI